MVLALDAVQSGNRRMTRVWLLGVIVLGGLFLGGQVFEFSHFYHEGLTLQQNLFGATFFVLTGFHGAHVTVGVIWMVTLLPCAARQPGTGSRPRRRGGRLWSALRRRRLDRHLHRRLPHTIAGVAADQPTHDGQEMQAHASKNTYWLIALILGIIMLEVAVFYVPLSTRSSSRLCSSSRRRSSCSSQCSSCI